MEVIVVIGAGQIGQAIARRVAVEERGATPRTAMTHIAIQESLDGKVAEWMERTTD